MNELLFEIGTEEIPAGYIEPALCFMAASVGKRFAELGLKHGLIRTAGTPRRLTLSVEDLQEKQEDQRVEHVGPATKAGFDDKGNPTKAAQGFARSKGVHAEDLRVIETAKGEYLMAVEEVTGKETVELLPALLAALFEEIPFPKSMHWAGSTLTFARPLQWLLILYNGEVVNLEIEGIQSDNRTCGHRFMAPDFFQVNDYADYLRKLEKNFVIAETEKRRQMVVEEVRRVVSEQKREQEAQPFLDEGLIDTVTNLLEIPWGVYGSFDERFLELPREVLVTSMREHQKYFPVTNGAGDLLPLFVAVNNTRVDDSEMAANGHERVLRARLEDGIFFFNEDKKHHLSDRLAGLSGIIFQRKLGTMEEKSRRMMELAGRLAEQLIPGKKEAAVRAARLAKVDLLTEMVGEFPSLQGVIGGEYARLDGEEEAVAKAIAEHYMPVRAGSELPATLIGAVVGTVDRVDTLVGCFAIGERPTGNKDSFGLRRQAIGLISIIRGFDLSLSLKEMVALALAGYEGLIEAGPDVVDQVLDFIRLRFENELLSSGYDQGAVEAATSVAFDDPCDCILRIKALQDICTHDAFVVLSASFKRIRNITGKNFSTDVEQTLLREDAEKELYAVVRSVRDECLPLIEHQAYDKALEVLLHMKEPVDRFFDEVMVMDKDKALCRNRLNLLTVLRQLVLRIGDISRMHVEK